MKHYNNTIYNITFKFYSNEKAKIFMSSATKHKIRKIVKIGTFLNNIKES